MPCCSRVPVALVTLFLVGALVMKPRIQSGLEDEARRALDAAGIPATVDFVFQDGRILCVDQLDDPEAARRWCSRCAACDR